MHQQKFAQLLMIESGLRTHFLPGKARRRGRSIAIERGVCDVAAAGPPAGADDFMRISFLHDLAQDRIRIVARRRGPSGEARDRQIKAAPEEMCRAGFADKARAKDLKHVVDRNQCAPEAPRIFFVIRSVYSVLVKSDGIGDLERHLPDRYVDLE